MISVGQRVPHATLYGEFFEVETGGCALGPNAFPVAELVRAAASSCSACPAHSRRPAPPSTYPGLCNWPTSSRRAGADEIWCHAVNDAFVRGAWGREQQTGGKVRSLHGRWRCTHGPARFDLDQDLGAARPRRARQALRDGAGRRGGYPPCSWKPPANSEGQQCRGRPRGCCAADTDQPGWSDAAARTYGQHWLTTRNKSGAAQYISMWQVSRY